MHEKKRNESHRGKLVLLTGVPGIGKSLIRNKLLSVFSHLEIIEFGDIVHQTASEEASVSRGDLRKAPDRYLSLSTLSRASRTLAAKVGSLRNKNDVIVIAHSAAKTDFGFYVIPEIQDLESIEMNGVIVLHGDALEIESRLSARDSGKAKMTRDQLATSQQILDSCAVSFSQRAGCPMYVVDVHSEIKSTLKGIVRVLEHVGLNCAHRKTSSHDTSE